MPDRVGDYVAMIEAGEADASKLKRARDAINSEERDRVVAALEEAGEDDAVLDFLMTGDDEE